MSGADIAREVSAAIAEAGAVTGGGKPLQGTIVRQGPANDTTYPPTPGVDALYACTLVLTSYSARDRDGSQITVRDLKAMISQDIIKQSGPDLGPDDPPVPSNGDKLRVAGQTYSVVNVKRVQPGGTILYYEAQVRSG